MTAIFVKPLSFTVVSANENGLSPASNANIDKCAMTWRSSNLTSVSVIIDLGTSASYDTVAIVGSNLRASDTVQIRTGATNTGTGSYAGSATAAYTGSKPAGTSTKAIYQIGTRTERYMRLDFVATSHPDGYVEAQRIVIGKAVNTLGVEYGAKLSWIDDSVIEDGLGYSEVAYEGRVKPQWAVSMSKISMTEWRGDWFPLLTAVGKKKAILFVPDLSAANTYQTDALFGRITSEIGGEVVGYDYVTKKLTITALAP